jgi:hypothetical protein
MRPGHGQQITSAPRGISAKINTEEAAGLKQPAKWRTINGASFDGQLPQKTSLYRTISEPASSHLSQFHNAFLPWLEGFGTVSQAACTKHVSGRFLAIDDTLISFTCYYRIMEILVAASSRFDVVSVNGHCKKMASRVMPAIPALKAVRAAPCCQILATAWSQNTSFVISAAVLPLWLGLPKILPIEQRTDMIAASPSTAFLMVFR